MKLTLTKSDGLTRAPDCKPACRCQCRPPATSPASGVGMRSLVGAGRSIADLFTQTFGHDRNDRVAAKTERIVQGDGPEIVGKHAQREPGPRHFAVPPGDQGPGGQIAHPRNGRRFGADHVVQFGRPGLDAAEPNIADPIARRVANQEQQSLGRRPDTFATSGRCAGRWA